MNLRVQCKDELDAVLNSTNMCSNCTPLDPTRQLEKRLERQPVTAFQQLEAIFCGDFRVLEKTTTLSFREQVYIPQVENGKECFNFQPNSEDFMLVLRPGDQETRIRRRVQKDNLCGKK